jgi:hypothetical protein
MSSNLSSAAKETIPTKMMFQTAKKRWKLTLALMEASQSMELTQLLPLQ